MDNKTDCTNERLIIIIDLDQNQGHACLGCIATLGCCDTYQF